MWSKLCGGDWCKGHGREIIRQEKWATEFVFEEVKIQISQIFGKWLGPTIRASYFSARNSNVLTECRVSYLVVLRALVNRGGPSMTNILPRRATWFGFSIMSSSGTGNTCIRLPYDGFVEKQNRIARFVPIKINVWNYFLFNGLSLCLSWLQFSVFLISCLLMFGLHRTVIENYCSYHVFPKSSHRAIWLHSKSFRFVRRRCTFRNFVIALNIQRDVSVIY